VGLGVAQKLIRGHLVRGATPRPGEEVALTIDQTLTQDATGTLVMLALEGLGLPRVRTELSAQYVDHNLVQADHRNPDDHRFLRSACRRYGVWYSPPGNGVSHAVHQERFGAPGKTLLGSDSHTPAAGSIGMLAMGAGGLDVALAMAGEPLALPMPEVWGVHLRGELPPWVSAKDLILEMLRRHGVEGAAGRILEYHGPGLASLSTMDRHVIANMGTELGAVTSVFPSDVEVRRFLRGQGREGEWTELVADRDPDYDHHEEIDLTGIEPMVALPSSPDRVRPVREVSGRPISQAYVGSSANPGYRDFAVVAETLRGLHAHEGVSLDINPSSRQILVNLARDGHLAALLSSGARIHQAGCNGCIGMGQAPATDSISLRTVPRNFPGRSGTREDRVYLVSPETAAASAFTGVITDPRTLPMSCPRVHDPAFPRLVTDSLVPPLPEKEARRAELERGPDIAAYPELDQLPDHLELPVLLRVADNVSTDEILPAGARALPHRSNIPRLSEFCFAPLDGSYHRRALEHRDRGGHAVVAGRNYGQGSSREHAALAPRFLGLRVLLARSFARIHRENLINFGVLPLLLSGEADYRALEPGSFLVLRDVRQALARGPSLDLRDEISGRRMTVRHDLSPRQVEIVLAGGRINRTGTQAG
jgi:aconitate hydratase